MLKHKTQRRLITAIKSVSELETYLQRTLKKLDQPLEPPADTSALVGWLYEQAKHWRSRRDAEPRTSEAFRFFDGKSEGIESVIRFLEEQSGKSRGVEGKGYLSSRDTTVDDQSTAETGTLKLSDTIAESVQ